MKGLFMKWVFMASWLITALITINTGLAVFGPDSFNFFMTDFVQVTLYNNNLITPLFFIILAAGLISLALFVMSAAGNCGCGSCNGKCK